MWDSSGHVRILDVSLRDRKQLEDFGERGGMI